MNKLMEELLCWQEPDIEAAPSAFCLIARSFIQTPGLFFTQSLRPLQYCFGYLCFVFIESHKEAIPCLWLSLLSSLKLFQFCYFILTCWSCLRFWHSDGFLFLLVIPAPEYSSSSTEPLLEWKHPSKHWSCSWMVSWEKENSPAMEV